MAVVAPPPPVEEDDGELAAADSASAAALTARRFVGTSSLMRHSSGSTGTGPAGAMNTCKQPTEEIPNSQRGGLG